MTTPDALVRGKTAEGLDYTYHRIGSFDGVATSVECRMVVDGTTVEGWEVAWTESALDRVSVRRYSGDTADGKQSAVELFLMLAHHALNHFERVHSEEWADVRPGGPHG